MAEEWRSVEILKLLRQCVVCPYCGVLVATQAGIDSHVAWHEQLNDYVASVETRLTQFSDYIINPETGLQKQIQDRLDTITNYVIAPTTGLEPRTTKAIQDLTTAINQLRTDATNAINSTNQAVAQLRTDATTAITGLTQRVSALEALPHA
jgi:hypothetical protein